MSCGSSNFSTARRSRHPLTGRTETETDKQTDKQVAKSNSKSKTTPDSSQASPTPTFPHTKVVGSPPQVTAVESCFI